ncbi:uncharacterized protein LOC114736483 [Neltuma alba]|uniref:uncharacterized protein LOC114736483 n=1 Tax=Neltuma alba TaxID=207710 RepID=UPI0010A3B106|nr:uncharacterized protein LOC114736483 [Prosopis alba]
MDLNLDEWDFLSDDGFLDFGEDGQKKVFLGKHYSDSISVFDADHFICPSPRSVKSIEPPRNSRLPNQLVPVPIPIRLDPGPPNDEAAKEIITKNPIDIPSASIQKNRGSQIGGVEADQDSVSQVFFKMKENEFVDMKMDSPKSGSRGMLPPIDTMKFDENGEPMEIMTSPRLKIEKEILTHNDQDSTWEHNKDGFNLWKWSFTGIGAICSFGVAAATVCILLFGSHQKNKLHHNHKIRFQIYADDKRIKQLMQQANKMNEAISAATGVPLSRAHITCGGYHDGL